MSSHAWGSLQKNISLHRAVQKTPYYVVFGKEPNKECHDAKTSDQQPQEDGVMKNEMTGLEQEEMENDTPNNKTLPDENSTIQYKMLHLFIQLSKMILNSCPIEKKP